MFGLCAILAFRALRSANLQLDLQFNSSFLGVDTTPVIQRDVETEVWGRGATPGSMFVVAIGGVNVTFGKAEDDGTWLATLPPHPATFETELKVSTQHAYAKLRVQFGDVIICGGQSNMGLTVGTGPFVAGRSAPLYGFHADNGTAESMASKKYTGKIQLKAMCGRPTQRPGISPKERTFWFPTKSDTLPYFSAVCWYTGKAVFEQLGGKVPIGLIQGANGGTAIEVFMPASSVAGCERPVTACHQNISKYGNLYDVIIGQLGRYRVSALLWDQGEADVSCNHTGVYACLERQLLRSWRQGLGVTDMVPAVAIQLPGYDTDCRQFCTDLLSMRLAQAEGVGPFGSVVATYDLSCPACPFGSVHNTHKTEVGARAARQLMKLWRNDSASIVSEGPRALRATLQRNSSAIYVLFSGAAAPFAFGATRNCTTCCHPDASTDFDVSLDGRRWGNIFVATLVEPRVVSLLLPPGFEMAKWLRYTANRAFPQCALRNAEGLPALPFVTEIES